MTRARRYAPRTLSGCCRALVVSQRCSECGKAAPWRKRLTKDEADRLAERERQTALVAVRISKEQAREALRGGYDD